MQFAEAVVDNFQGYRDAGLIDSAIAAARYQEIYGGVDDPVVLGVHLMNTVQRQQALVDGNKRLGLALGMAFIEENGHPRASEEVDELALADRMLALAAERLTVAEFADWLREQVRD